MGNTTLRSAAHSQYADMFCWSTPRRRCRLRPVWPGLRLGRSAGGGSIRTLLLLLLVSQGRRNVSNYGGASYKRTTFDCFFPLFRLRQNLRGAIGPWVPTPLLSCSLIVLTEWMRRRPTNLFFDRAYHARLHLAAEIIFFTFCWDARISSRNRCVQDINRSVITYMIWHTNLRKEDSLCLYPMYNRNKPCFKPGIATTKHSLHTYWQFENVAGISLSFW